MAFFTEKELEEMRRADEEIEANFRLTNEDIRRSRELDENAKFARKSNNQQKIAENQRAYREANREKIAENQRAYYEANREKIAENQRAYREANREKINEYMRLYLRKRRAAKRAMREETTNEHV